MRKVYAIVLLFVVCLGLFACDGPARETDFIGTWEGSYDGNPHTIILYEGGTGKAYGSYYQGVWYTSTSQDISWTLNGDVINISFRYATSGRSRVEGFKLNNKNQIVLVSDNSVSYQRVN